MDSCSLPKNEFPVVTKWMYIPVPGQGRGRKIRKFLLFPTRDLPTMGAINRLQKDLLSKPPPNIMMRWWGLTRCRAWMCILRQMFVLQPGHWKEAFYIVCPRGVEL